MVQKRKCHKIFFLDDTLSKLNQKLVLTKVFLKQFFLLILSYLFCHTNPTHMQI